MHEPERGEQVTYGCLSAARRARLCKALGGYKVSLVDEIGKVMLKFYLNTLLCRIGIHTWEQRTCVEQGCKRCSNIQHKDSHQWQAITSSKQCGRMCSKCAASEQFDEHQWSITEEKGERDVATGKSVSSKGAAYDKWIGEEYERIVTVRLLCLRCGIQEVTEESRGYIAY